MSTDPSVPDLIPFANWGSTTPDFGDAGDEIMLLDSSPSTQLDIVTYGTGSYTGVVGRAALAPSEFISRSNTLRDTDNNATDFSVTNCAGTIVFDGGSSGLGTAWNTATNWRDTTTNADRLPTTTDHVCIPNLVPGAVTFDTGTTSVLSITSDEMLNVTGGTLNITSTLQPSEMFALNLSGGEFGGAGSVTFTNTFHWSGGFLNGPNSTAGTTIAPGALWLLDGTSNKFLYTRTVTNNSSTPVNWTGAGGIYLGNSAVLNNSAGSTINVNGDQDINYYTGAVSTFNNAGTFAKTGGSGDGFIDATINNSGTIAASSGNLQLYRDGTMTGPFTVANGASLEFRPFGTFNLSSSATVTGATGSTVRFAQSGTTNLNGAYNVPTTEISGSTN